jgi:hypothetical protein
VGAGAGEEGQGLDRLAPPSAPSGDLQAHPDKMYGHVKLNKNRSTFLAFCRYLWTLYPPEVRMAIVLDNFSPHLSTKKDQGVGQWAAANNVELAYVPPTPPG